MDDMNTMLDRSALPGGLCSWLKYLRTPGVSLRYTVEKRHIPDMTAAPAAETSGTPAGGSPTGPCGSTGYDQSPPTASGNGSEKGTDSPVADAAQNSKNSHNDNGFSRISTLPSPSAEACACTAAKPALSATDTTDIMRVSGTLRARYFDLAAGMLAIVAACCLVKGCLCGCRCIRRHMC